MICYFLKKNNIQYRSLAFTHSNFRAANKRPAHLTNISRHYDDLRESNDRKFKSETSIYNTFYKKNTFSAIKYKFDCTATDWRKSKW